MNRKVEEKMAGNRNNDMNVYCSFCGKSQEDVTKVRITKAAVEGTDKPVLETA
ncbi:TPA: hypothetical protein ACGMYF_001404 [Streptococcus agalactiae]